LRLQLREKFHDIAAIMAQNPSTLASHSTYMVFNVMPQQQDI